MALTRFHSRSFMHFYDFFYVEKEKISNQLFVNKSRADKQIAFTRFRRCRRFQICEGRTVKKMWWTFESFSSFRRIRKKILIYYLSKVFTFFTFCLNISIEKHFSSFENVNHVPHYANLSLFWVIYCDPCYWAPANICSLFDDTFLTFPGKQHKNRYTIKLSYAANFFVCHLMSRRLKITNLRETPTWHCSFFTFFCWMTLNRVLLDNDV